MPTPGAVKAGNAFIEIEAIDKTSAVLNTVGYNMFRFARNIENVGRSLTLLGVVTSLPAFLSVARFSEFDNVMRRVQARTQGTVDEMKGLRSEAKRLGQETSVTATRIGEMMGILGQKGFTRRQILGSIQALANLSIATGEGSPFDHEFAAKALTGTMAAFGINPEDAKAVAEVADKLTAAVNASNFTMEELSVTMSYAGTIAKMFNLSLDETLALTGQLRNLNIEASSAGTALRNMLSEISEQKNRDVLNKMLQGFGSKHQINAVDVKGNLKALPQILFDLGEAMKGLGTAQQGEIMTKLFGKRSMVPAMALSQGKNPFRDLLGAIQNSEGLAERTRKTMEAGITGTIERVLGALDALAQTVGEILSPSLVDLGGKIEALLVSMATWITENKAVVYTYTALVLGTTALGLSMIVLGIHLKAVALLVGVLGGALTILSVTMRMAVYPLIVAVNVATVLTQIIFGTAATIFLLSSRIFLLVGSMRVLQAFQIALAASTWLYVAALRGAWFVAAQLRAALVMLNGIIHICRVIVIATTVSLRTFAATMKALAATSAVLQAGITALNITIATLAGLLSGSSIGAPILLVVAGAAALYGIFKLLEPTVLSVIRSLREEMTLWSMGMEVTNTRIMDAFSNMWNYISRRGSYAFESISQAWKTAMVFLELGDVESAWNVGLLAMEVVWYETLAGLAQAWVEFDTALNLTGLYEQVLAVGKAFWSWVQPLAKAASLATKAVFTVSTTEEQKQIIKQMHSMMDQVGDQNTKKWQKFVEEKQRESEGAQFNLQQYRTLAAMKKKKQQLEEEANNSLEENKTNPADYSAPSTFGPSAVASIAEVKSLNALAYKSIEAAKAAYENANRQVLTQEQIAQSQLKELQKLNRRAEEALEEVRND